MPDAATLAALEKAVDANWDKQVAWLQDLVRFPSLRGKEGPCQDWIARAFAQRGWSVDRYTLDQVAMDHLPGFSPVMDTDYAQAVQVVATVRAPEQKGRSLILQGHVDVVPEGPADMWTHPPYDPVIKDGWMNGRGAHDMKQGVSAMVFAMDALRSAGLAPAADVYVQTVTEEECTGNGALSTLARGYRADACLIPEPTANTITRSHVGVMWFRLRVRGVPVHVAHAQTGTNAILAAYGLIQAVQKLTAEINQRARAHPWFKDIADPVKFNPGVIRGGDWGSSTPAWCEVDCRIGLLPGTPLEQARQEVLDAVAGAARGDSFMANNPPEVIWNGFQADGYTLDPGSEAEQVLAGAHQAVFGTKMQARLGTGVNDTRFYGLYYGITGLCYGPAGEGAHAFDERAHLPSLKRTTLAIAAFIADWCGTRPA
ncbi:ArgE/DapE family deacylase [Limobrevibacterium gyesilva]|uniref:ArgE/DapE family deacylase n=1 Tax=Limobrevibacterium gyesilva TaxID=2991712 RepID=A0AA41YIH0_9PROT|nr:ArgE/DapE family deacylase [Limobrevibacterium gyesilva]MCW3474194.1 ArgE/DapE family deacylase [Limobrevibacterium gyesilva]